MKEKILTKVDSIEALKKMKKFHDDLSSLMYSHDFDLLENLGRRNILLSQAQEKFFADVLSKKFDVRNDGRTGEPDIVIESLGREIECKLTSPQKKGNISFQTDYETLVKKGSLDYLYVVADKEFEKFAVIHYEDLKISDFRALSPGARGKTQLMKHRAHDRANVLVGSMSSVNKRELDKLSKKLPEATTENKRKKILKSIKYWETTPEKFNINLEAVNENVSR